MRILNTVLLTAALSMALLAQAPAGPPSTPHKVGDTAPDFTLPSTDGGKVHLAEHIGTNTVVLAFFVAAFTGG